MQALTAHTNIGGQAVMEGILMRNGEVYALALRLPDGSILAERRPWFSLTRGPLKLPFVRGFPLLVETLVNGIQALNRSAAFALPDEETEESPAESETGAEGLGTAEKAVGAAAAGPAQPLVPPDAKSLSGWQVTLTLFVALGLAILLFVVAPHVLSLLMQALGLGSSMEGLSFHLWDGLFKFGIFILYIVIIGFVPDIRRVFQYHGAEHKVIHAMEKSSEVSVRTAAKQSCLHPRCGTTFLLVVLCLAIVLHTVLVPPFLAWLQAPSALVKHGATLLFKVALIVPISAVAYEVIRFTARMGDHALGQLLRAPGLLLQLLSTREPDKGQLEVALVALREAVRESVPQEAQPQESASTDSPAIQSVSSIITPAYTVLE